MSDDLLTRARMLPADPVIDELIAEIERLRSLAELWDALEEALESQRGQLHTSFSPNPRREWQAIIGSSAPLPKWPAARGETLPEAVRALLEREEARDA